MVSLIMGSTILGSLDLSLSCGTACNHIINAPLLFPYAAYWLFNFYLVKAL